MKFERQDAQGKFLITGYGDRNFRVAGKVQEGAVLVSAEYAEPAPFEDFDAFDAARLLQTLEQIGSLDVLLIGTGKAIRLLDKDSKAVLLEAGINFDVMDSGAAARTYNVLMMEDRPVACILFPAGI